MITFMQPLQSPFRYKALSTDEKPTDATYGSMLLEEDTGVWYIFYGGVWSVASTSSFDPSSGTLTIYHDVPQLDVQPWDSYAADVKSLIIEDGVTVGAGAFDSLTSLEYVSIGENVQLGQGAFSIAMKDYMDQTVQPAAGKYVGYSGALYLCDPSIFVFSVNHNITGLASSASGAVNLIIPSEIGGVPVAGLYNSAFDSKTAIQRVMVLPEDYSLIYCGANIFSGCTSLTHAELPDSLDTIGYRSFFGDASLETVRLPASLATVSGQVFLGCASLTNVDLGSTSSIGSNAFSGCTGLESVHLSADLDEIKDQAFYGCTGVTEVSFASGFAPATLNSTAFRSWTFYASDGTTVLDKTVAANLAGKTFQGTAAALVEVSEGQLSLTPQQLQQVQLHAQELQDLKDHLTIDPLPFQPSLQTEQEQVAEEPEEPTVEEGALEL